MNVLRHFYFYLHWLFNHNLFDNLSGHFVFQSLNLFIFISENIFEVIDVASKFIVFCLEFEQILLIAPIDSINILKIPEL